MQTAQPTSSSHLKTATLLADLAARTGERALALMDLNRTSATYGCADRPYWYYRTLTNFSGSTWQQVMVGLAALYKAQHPLNPMGGREEILEAASASLAYWAQIAHPDGAFDEWYLNEFSYCPTAITGAGAAQTLDLIGDKLSDEVRDAASNTLCRTATWLDRRYNPTVMNQNLAAAVALAGAGKIDPKWMNAASAKLARVRSDQSPEGWFPEYSGADLGYSTLALDLLAGYHRLTGAPEAVEMAKALTKWLVGVQGGWRALGGRIGSRGTAHAFPFGALYFSQMDDAASLLASFWLEGLSSGVSPRPSTVDDRYFAYFYFPEFALALHQSVIGINGANPPSQQAKQGILEQSGSGLVAIRRPEWSALISRRLAGALAIEGRGGPACYHLGYEIDTADGRFSSANWDADADCEALSNNVITATGEFRASSAGVPLKTLMAPFQLVVGFLGTSSLAEAFQGAIKKKMIAPKKTPGLRIERKITLVDNSLSIRDEFTPRAGLPSIKRLDIARTVAMHSPSARQDIARVVQIPDAMLASAAADINAGKRTTLAFRINPISCELVAEQP